MDLWALQPRGKKNLQNQNKHLTLSYKNYLQNQNPAP